MHELEEHRRRGGLDRPRNAIVTIRFPSGSAEVVRKRRELLEMWKGSQWVELREDDDPLLAHVVARALDGRRVIEVDGSWYMALVDTKPFV